MKLIFYLLDCVLLASTSTTTLQLPFTKNEKIVIIIVQCDKNYTIDVRMPSSAIHIPSSLNPFYGVAQ